MNGTERPHILLREYAPPATRQYNGGGGGTYPRTSYAQHANAVFRQASELRAMFASLNATGQGTDRAYFRLELPADFSIAGSDGRKIEEVVHSNIVGAPSPNVGHFGTSAESFSLLMEELQRYADTDKNVGKSKFAPIENLGAIPIAEKLGPGVAEKLDSDDASLDVLLGLFPDLLNTERQAVRQAVEAYLAPVGGHVTGETEGESGSYLRVQARPSAIRAIADSIIAIQSVDQTEQVVELSSRPGPPIEAAVLLQPSDSAPIVCVIDTGVASGCRFIDPFVIERETPLGPPYDEDHGTFVASRALFGDTIRDQISSGVLENRVRLVSVAAFARGPNGNRINPTTDELIRIVRDTVTRWHGRTRIFNLSINLTPRGGASAAPIADTVSPLAAEIDALSRRFGVLFVVSAGNFPAPGAPWPTESYPEYFRHESARVLSPAEAMLAITVGSSAERENGGSIARAGNPSPFTRRGPGVGSFRKPDLIAHGGNCGAGGRDQDDLSVAGIGADENVSYASGTSFAAPIISSLAAQILDAIPNATVELARALLVHFAELIPEARDSEVMSSLVGNGRVNPGRILRSTKWEQTFAFIGHVGFRQILKIPFFVPSGLTNRKMRGRLRVRCTIAFSPETNRTLRAGYCKSHLRCKVIKLAENGAAKEVTGDDAPEAIKERYSSVVRIEKLFSSHVGPGDWQLLIEQESRWRLKDPKTPVAALITIEDPSRAGSVDIYSMIRAEARGRYMAELSARHQLRV